MKKRKNLIKTLALCSILGLGVGYAVIGNQELTYTEAIPVGTRSVDVRIVHEDATNNGLSLTINKTTESILDNLSKYQNDIQLRLNFINNETDFYVRVDADLIVYADGNPIEVDWEFIGFENAGKDDDVLKANTTDTLVINYNLSSILNEIEQYNSISIVVTFTARPFINN